MRTGFLFCICLLGTCGLVTLNAQESLKKDGYTRILYPNGKVSSEGVMRNGKPDGFWKTFYPSGIIKSEGKRVNFLLDSTWVFYNESGDTLEKVNYVLGKRNGYTLTYNVENLNDPMNRGRIILKELFVNDKKEGVSYAYYPNGKIKEEAYYSDSKRNGITHEFDEKGAMISVLTYKSGVLTDREKINRKDQKGLKQGLWRTFYDNGKIKSEAEYRDDILNGPYKEYDEEGNIKVLLEYANGAILEEKDTTALEIEIRNKYDNEGNLTYSGSYRKNIPVGVHRMYDSSGKVINGILYSNNGVKAGEGIITNEGKKEGPWKYYNEKGNVISSGSYQNNQQIGKWVFLYENGKTEQAGEYKQGKADGLWQWYFKDGNLKREEEFYEGKSEGMYAEYDTLGETIVSGKYFDGQKEEEWIYKVGDNVQKGKYVGDLKDGVWQEFYSDGTLEYEGNYIQGNPDGEHVFYYPNGRVRETNYYIMGICEKNWKKYDENGMLLLTITYKDNQEYRINGEKIDFAQEDIKLIQ